MLSIEEFRAAGIDERLKAVKDTGDYVLKTEESGILCRVYQYNRFFVELVYSVEFGTLKDIKALSVMEAAEKYISLEDKLDLFE